VRDDFRGRVVLLAFLDDARPSRRLLERLNRLHEGLGGKGLTVVRVYEAPADDGAAAKEWGRASPTAAALVAPGLVPGGYSDAFYRYAVRATPTLFLIDRQGVLRHLDVETDDLEGRLAEVLRPFTDPP
jgi:hypothetical protein